MADKTTTTTFSVTIEVDQPYSVAELWRFRAAFTSVISEVLGSNVAVVEMSSAAQSESDDSLPHEEGAVHVAPQPTAQARETRIPEAAEVLRRLRKEERERIIAVRKALLDPPPDRKPVGIRSGMAALSEKVSPLLNHTDPDEFLRESRAD